MTNIAAIGAARTPSGPINRWATPRQRSRSRTRPGASFDRVEQPSTMDNILVRTYLLDSRSRKRSQLCPDPR